tara:strand:- start:1855 stop:2937 length:1083 start_codon:yes stop_codon:yes gene_type:complete
LENLEIKKNFFWNNKTVLVTGHTGFKGSWLCFYLNYLGCNVIGYSLKPNKNHKLFSILNIKDKLKFNLFSNIENKKKLSEVIKKYNPEIIFHLAAQPLVIDSYKDPKGTIDTNIIGTINLLEIAKMNNKIKSIVIVTSDKCYKVKQDKTYYFNEESELGGLDPYSASKACTEILTNSYVKSFFNQSKKFAPRVSTVRSGNILGGGDWGQYRLITDIINAKTNKTKLKIRNLESVRPWIHVLDTLTGYIKIAKKNYETNKFVGPWNFSPLDKKPRRVKKIVEYCVKNNFLDKKQINVTKTKYHETKVLMLDSRKANEYLKWKPKLNFNEVLNYTFDWYAAYRKKENMEKYTINQIKEFLKK